MELLVLFPGSSRSFRQNPENGNHIDTVSHSTALPPFSVVFTGTEQRANGLAPAKSCFLALDIVLHRLRHQKPSSLPSNTVSTGRDAQATPRPSEAPSFGSGRPGHRPSQRWPGSGRCASAHVRSCFWLSLGTPIFCGCFFHIDGLGATSHCFFASDLHVAPLTCSSQLSGLWLDPSVWCRSNDARRRHCGIQL